MHYLLFLIIKGLKQKYCISFSCFTLILNLKGNSSKQINKLNISKDSNNVKKVFKRNFNVTTFFNSTMV